MMKLSDYVAQFVAKQCQLEKLFLLPGGGCMHLVDSFGQCDATRYYLRNPSLARIARYLCGSVCERYFNRLLRLPTILSNPLRDA